jgi:hypothetical protein
MPERNDSDQEDITLPPRTTTRLIAEAAARQVIIEHISLCPFSKSDVEQRLRVLETNYARLIGFMIGSGLLGGAAGALVSKLWPH